MELINAHGTEGLRGQTPIAPTGMDAGSTMSTANAGDEEMVRTKTEKYDTAGPVGPNGSGAKAQVVKTKVEDTLVKKSEVKNVQSQNQRRYEEQKAKISQ